MNNQFGIIMAGGIGTRFWPESTPEMPKQFLDLLGNGKSFIQQTFERLNKLIPFEQIYILTNERYRELIKEQIPQISDKQIIAEPVMRNTAPAILYAAKKIHQINNDALMLVAPSDHYIANEEKFTKNVQTAFDEVAQSDKLMTLGIVPNAPVTGYGYIQFDKNEVLSIKKVLQFTEKPDLTTAHSFLNQGNYLWNAGIFVWSSNSILQAFKKYLPEMYQIMSRNDDVFNTTIEKDFIKKNFPLLDNISIDYGILEKADNVYVLPAEFVWNDLGAWNAIYNQLKGDADNVTVNAELLAENSKGNLVKTNHKNVVLKDLQDYAIIDTENVLMIIPRKDDQKVKEYASYFAKNNNA
jgi:mannose-1-phosphate guanylyltransferase